MGPRGTGPREINTRAPRPQQDNPPVEVDNWDNAQVNTIDNNISSKSGPGVVFPVDTWGDWDNEEYTGSLADTKVFTPSSAPSLIHSTSKSFFFLQFFPFFFFL